MRQGLLLLMLLGAVALAQAQVPTVTMNSNVHVQGTVSQQAAPVVDNDGGTLGADALISCSPGGAANVTFTLPSAATATVREYRIIKADATTGQCIVQPATGEFINGVQNGTSAAETQWSDVVLTRVSTTSWQAVRGVTSLPLASLPAAVRTRTCLINISNTVPLTNSDDEADACVNNTGVAGTITAVACKVDNATGTPTVDIKATSVAGSSILSGAMNCGTGYTAGTVSAATFGTYSGTGLATCSVAPCNLAVDFTAGAGGTAQKVTVKIAWTVP